jgi:hypothetical protein
VSLSVTYQKELWMNVTRSIVGGLAAAGLVLGLGSAASAAPQGYDDDHKKKKDDYCCVYDYGQGDVWYAEDAKSVHGQWEANHVGKVYAPRTNIDIDTDIERSIINTFDD